MLRGYIFLVIRFFFLFWAHIHGIIRWQVIHTLGPVLTRKYYLKILSEKNEEPFFFDKKTRLVSKESQHHLKILPKSAGQPSHAARARAKDRGTAVLWACLAQFMFLFALDKPHSIKIHQKFDKTKWFSFFFF